MSANPASVDKRPSPLDVFKIQDGDSIMVSSLKVGAACGSTGFVLGGAIGILKETTPFIFGAASGLQTFALGSSFWAVRRAALETWTPEQQTAANYVKASTFSGGLCGGVVGLVTRGRSNALPGAIMLSLGGYVGQSIANRYTFAPEEKPVLPEREPLWKRIANMEWSPVKVLNDEEYVVKLREKMLKLDVEIAVIDDRIAALQQKEVDSGPSTTSSKP